jgi:ribonuclease P protein component
VASKAHPLKKSSSYSEVAKKSKKVRLSNWLTLQILPSEDHQNHFGITVSRKVAKSVTRNKLKRWVKNCVRREKWPEKYNGSIFVFVFKPQADDKFFSKLKYYQFKDLYIGLK